MSGWKMTLALLVLTPLLTLGAVWALLRFVTCALVNHDKAWNIALMVDQTANVGANGKVDMSISARAAIARANHHRWGCVLCRVLEWFQTHHCDRALAHLEQRTPP